MKVDFTILEEFEDSRVDKYLSETIDELSRSYIQKLLKDGLIFVNGEKVKSSYRLMTGDRVIFEAPSTLVPDIKAENIPIDIVYEDKDIVIVNKGKGMVVHPAPGNYSGTLVNALMYHCGNELSGINGIARPGIVHRIDKNTTGLLVVCKNDFSHVRVSEQLKKHTVTRKYEGIVLGRINDEQGRVEAPIGRNPKDRKKMAVTSKNGKNAITNYSVIRRLAKHTHIECSLETGRTHQIRVHMAYIHHPLLGDDVYGIKKQDGSMQGQTLHAKILGLIHPRTNTYMEFEAPVPEYFEKLLQTL